MQTINTNPVVVSESDFPVLKRLAATSSVDAGGEMSLMHEIKRAIIVKDSAFPPNTIRIGSSVRIVDLDTQEGAVLKLVLPGHANIRQKKISILTPMGAALIGFREGDIVSWKMPSGLKHFKVLEVKNSSE